MRTTLLDVLKASGVIVSTSKGRRLILQGALSLNGKELDKFDDLNMTIFSGDVIQVGKETTLFADEYFEIIEKK